MNIATERARNEERGKRRLRGAVTVILRILLALFTTLLVIALALAGVVYVFEKGPSKAARNIFCISCMETSALKWVPNVFLSEDEVAEIVASNNIVSSEELTDTSLVKIPEKTDPTAPKDESIDPDGDGIDIFDVKGSTYKGKMMVVYDPSRVFVATCGEFGLNKYGKRVIDMCEEHGAVAGINAGGYEDGVASDFRGGMPLGVVVSEGELVFGSPYSTLDMVGITRENKLVCGKMTVQNAIDMGVRDAVYFDPSLIINGKPVEHIGSGSGLNPRAAIGQRADGAILLLTIDGRQSNSLGAGIADVRDQMEKFGAVNAYNLDGGASTTMVYNGEAISQSSLLQGHRNVCTAFLVRPQE